MFLLDVSEYVVVGLVCYFDQCSDTCRFCLVLDVFSERSREGLIWSMEVVAWG